VILSKFLFLVLLFNLLPFGLNKKQLDQCDMEGTK